MESENRRQVNLTQEIINEQKQRKNQGLDHSSQFMTQDSNPQVWEKNKLKMKQILQRAPVVGVYKNQDKKEWQKFYQFYIDFLNAQIGPRGECAKKIRAELLAKKEVVDTVLGPYNMSHKTHIRSIYVYFRYYVPCPEYHELKIIQQTLNKSVQSLSRLNNVEHPMFQSIRSGLIKKHGKDYNYLEKINQLKENYSKKVQKLTVEREQIVKILQNKKEYTNYRNMLSQLSPYFDQWVEADSGMGKNSVNRGQLFEKKVLYNVIPYIMIKQRNRAFSHIQDQSIFSIANIKNLVFNSKKNTTKTEQKNILHIFLNMKWCPKSLGEIDITIAQFIPLQNRYEALVLIQCKARLLDIRQASYQVDPKYFAQQQKFQLSSKCGPVYINKKAVSYIVTTLPDFQFVLPVQSKLKQVLDKGTKDKPVEQIIQEEMKETLYQKCQQRFKDQLSPRQWFQINDSDNIIVLSSQS